MRRSVLLGTSVLLLLIIGSIGMGCGGQGATSVVVNLTLTPIQMSLNRGATAQITAQALNANNVAVASPPLAFHSSSSAITVSPTGLVCAGQWDASFVTCLTCSNPGLTTNQCPDADLLPPGNANITATALTANVTVTSSVPGLQVGAHPGFPDREHFGREDMQRSEQQILEDCLYQVGALAGLARAVGFSPRELLARNRELDSFAGPSGHDRCRHPRRDQSCLRNRQRSRPRGGRRIGRRSRLGGFRFRRVRYLCHR